MYIPCRATLDQLRKSDKLENYGSDLTYDLASRSTAALSAVQFGITSKTKLHSIESCGDDRKQGFHPAQTRRTRELDHNSETISFDDL
jgi:hypothetical protein